MTKNMTKVEIEQDNPGLTKIDDLQEVDPLKQQADKYHK